MPFPIADFSLGSRFWQVSDLGAVMDKAVDAGIAAREAVKDVRHDASVFSFAADATGESVRAAINRAEIFAARHTLSQAERDQEAARAASNAADLGVDCDALAAELAAEPDALPDGMDAGAFRENLRKAAGKLLATREFTMRAKQGALGDEGMFALKNAVRGMAQMLREGRISEDAALVLADGNFYDAENRADMLRLAADSAARVRAIFSGEEALDAIIAQCRADLAHANLPERDAATVRAQIAALEIQRNEMVQARLALCAGIKTDCAFTDCTGAVKSDSKFQYAELDKIRDSLRAFRYDIDRCSGKGFGRMESVRRKFDNFFSGYSGPRIGADAFENLKTLDAAFNAMLAAVRAKIGGITLEQALAAHGAKADIAADAEAATSLSHITNDRIRYHYSGVEERSRQFKKAVEAELGGIAASGGTRTVSLRVDADFIFGVDAGLAELKARAGLDVTVSAKITVAPGGGTVDVVYTREYKGHLGAGAKLGVDPDGTGADAKAGMGATAKAMAGAGLVRSVKKTYASIDDFVRAMGGSTVLVQTRIRDRVLSATASAARAVGHAFVLGATVLGFREHHTSMDQLEYAESLRKKNVFGSLAGLMSSKRNAGLIGRRSSYAFVGELSGRAKGGMYFPDGEGDDRKLASDKEAHAGAGLRYTRETSLETVKYKSFAKSFEGCSAQYLSARLEEELAAIRAEVPANGRLASWMDRFKARFDAATSADPRAIAEFFARSVRSFEGHEKRAASYGSGDKAKWTAFAYRSRLIALAVAAVAARADALAVPAGGEGAADIAKAKAAASSAREYLLPRIANPSVAVPERIFEEKFLSAVDVKAPRRQSLTFSIEGGIDLFKAKAESIADGAGGKIGLGSGDIPADAKSLKDAGHLAAKGVYDTGAGFVADVARNAIQVDTRIGVSVTKEWNAGKTKDVRPWVNSSVVKVEARINPGTPLRVLIEFAARGIFKAVGGADTIEDSKLFEEIKADLVDGMLENLEESVVENSGKILDYGIGELAKRSPSFKFAMYSVLGWGKSALDFLNPVDVGRDEDTYKKITLVWTDGRFTGLSLSEDAEYSLKAGFAPKIAPVEAGFKYSSKTSTVDYTVLRRPPASVLIARVSDLLDTGNPSALKNFLARNKAGTLRLLGCMKANAPAPEGADARWTDDRDDFAQKAAECLGHLARMSSGPEPAAGEAKQIKRDFDAAYRAVQEDLAALDDAARLDRAQALLAAMAKTYSLAVRNPPPPPAAA